MKDYRFFFHPKYGVVAKQKNIPLTICMEYGMLKAIGTNTNPSMRITEAEARNYQSSHLLFKVLDEEATKNVAKKAKIIYTENNGTEHVVENLYDVLKRPILAVEDIKYPSYFIDSNKELLFVIRKQIKVLEIYLPESI